MDARARRSSRWRFLALLFAFTLCPFPFSPVPLALSQQVVDKMVATVNAGIVPECRQICLITYSDLLWQLALQPNTPLDNPTSVDLNRALSLLIDQRLILQEAEKLPSIAPTSEEVKAARDELVKAFPSPAEFQRRLQSVGLTAEKLDEILEQRLRIEKYLDFRFRNFVVITQKEIADYYKDTYVPRLKTRAPGQIVPTLEEARAEIERTLTEAKIESDTDTFLDNARERSEIVILNPV
jgi:parvulin-like peptidyl-prolyl isomerase